MLTVILLIMVVSMAQTTTSVNRVYQELDNFIINQVEGWKYSDNLENSISEMSQTSFDDTDWQNLEFGQHINEDSCWFRAVYVVPDKMMGQTVSGELRIKLAVDDFGYLWINGEEKGYFPWDGEFTLTQNASPGQKIVLLIKMVNTAGPGRLLSADILMQKLKPRIRDIENISLSLRVAQKLLSGDTYQVNERVKYDPGIDRSDMDPEKRKMLYVELQSLSENINITALKTGSDEEFEKTIRKIRENLKKFDEIIKQYTLFFVSNAHIDAAWLWRKKETVAICKNTFSSVIEMMKTHPDFIYAQSSSVFYKWMEEIYPKLFQEIQEAVNSGRWDLMGGTWIEPDCNLIDGISWARQLLLGHKYFEKNFGKKVKIGWNPDSFGYNWNLPQFYLNAGIDFFITQKLGWNDTNVFPHRVFWWKGPDGSQILSYFPFKYVNTLNKPFQLVDWLRQFEANTGFRNLMVLFGVGDHGGGPTPEMLERIEKLKDLYVFPTVKYGSVSEYKGWLKQQDLSQLPTWEDELYLEYHRGTYTTQAKMKAYNREAEIMLSSLEKIASFATQLGYSYPAKEIEDAWEFVLFNQFHDILPGSSIREVHLDAEKDYQKAEQIWDFEIRKALAFIGEQINTSNISQGKPVLVFNPNNWERTDVAHLKLEMGDLRNYQIFSSNGYEIPSQIIQKDRYNRELLFVAENIPSCGYSIYELREGDAGYSSPILSAQANTLENEFFTIRVDEETGWIQRIWDKRNEREILNGPGNELQLFEDKPSDWDAWNIELGRQYKLNYKGMEIVDNGPVRAVIRVYHDFKNPGVNKSHPTENFPTSFFEQDIVLYDEIPRIDFKIKVDWWEDKSMLKVAFPLAVESEVATYEIPNATIKRTTDPQKQQNTGKWEVPAVRWADVSENDYGVSLLNSSKYGYDIKNNIVRLSLVRSPKWPDPTADRGEHTIKYALYPHKGGWKKSQVPNMGYNFNTPLLYKIIEKYNGKLSNQHSFMELRPENLILTSVKKAEDSSDAWIIQWYESTGKKSKAALKLPFIPSRVYLSNFLEEEKEELSVDRNRIEVNTSAYQTVTLKILL